MTSTGRKSQQHIPLRDILPRNHIISFNCSNSRSRTIKIVAMVQRRHFSCFTPQEGTPRLDASLSDSLDEGNCVRHVEFSTSIVIEEEKWFCTLDKHVVYIHRD